MQIAGNRNKDAAIESSFSRQNPPGSTSLSLQSNYSLLVQQNSFFRSGKYSFANLAPLINRVDGVGNFYCVNFPLKFCFLILIILLS